MSKNQTVSWVIATTIVCALLLLMPWRACAAKTVWGPPQITVTEAGATIEDVTVETYGVVKPAIVRRFLSLHAGDQLEQEAVNRDFDNLKILAAYIPRLLISPGDSSSTVRLHWIVMAKNLLLTGHPFYADPPLTPGIQGIGFILYSPPVDKHGSNVQVNTQLSRRANLVRVLYVNPVHVNPVKGRESDFVADVFGGRGVYRESFPQAIDVYSWNTGAEAFWYVHGTNGNQLETGARVYRGTTQYQTSLVAPSLYSTFLHPARNTALEFAYSHDCNVAAIYWYPPYCKYQYRAQVVDAIGGLGATNQFQLYIADAAQYTRIGNSTLALHGYEGRSGGVLSDSLLLCTLGESGYPKPFCGTDAQLLQAEYRIADAVHTRLHFVIFTETSASRVRGSELPFAPSTFTWNADSGIGVIYSGIRVNYAHGNQGGRITLALQGQVF